MISSEQRSQPRLGMGETVLAALLLLLAVAIAWPAVFLNGEIPTAADILFEIPPWQDYAPPGFDGCTNRIAADIPTAMTPFYAISQQAISDGEWPLWNSYELGGIPLMANCQSAVFNPIRLGAVFLPLPYAVLIHMILKIWLCGFLTYLCVRLVGIGRLAAAFAAVTWMFCACNYLWTYWPIPDVSPWLPVLWMGVEFLFMERYRKGFFAVLLGGTMMLFAGHPEMAFAQALTIGCYTGFRFVLQWHYKKPVSRAFWLLVLAWTAVLAVTAVQWLPFAEYLLNSATFFVRKEAEFKDWAQLGTLLMMWVFRFYGTYAEYEDFNYWGPAAGVYHNHYFGLLPWILMALAAGCGLFHWRKGQRIPAMMGAAVIVFGVTFNLFFFRYINMLPVMSSMRPIYFSHGFAFAMIIVAAEGLEVWCKEPRRLKPWLAPLVLTGVITGILAFAYFHHRSYSKMLGMLEYQHFQFLMAGFYIAAFALLLFLVQGKVLTRVLKVGLILLCTFDLLFTERAHNATVPAPYFFPRTDLMDFMASKGRPCRFQVGTGNVLTGTSSVYGVEEWLGYDGIYPARSWNFQQGLGKDLWVAMEPACSIDYYLDHPRFEPVFPLEEPGRFEHVGQFDGLDVYKNTKALGRARLVGRVEVIEAQEALFARMVEPGFDPANIVLLEKPLDIALPESDEDPGAATISKYLSTEVHVNVDAKRDSVLVLSDNMYPGWKAYIDGEEEPLFHAYYAFRGLVVPEGRHEVVYRYEPWTFRVGLVVSVCALISLGILALLFLRSRILRGRRAPSTERVH